MLKIKPNPYDKISNDYKTLLIPKIKENYIKFKNQNQPINFLNNTFPINELFDNETELSNLLINRLDQPSSRVNAYIKTCTFISWLYSDKLKYSLIKNYYGKESKTDNLSLFLNTFSNQFIEVYNPNTIQFAHLNEMRKHFYILKDDLKKLNTALSQILDYNLLSNIKYLNSDLHHELLKSTDITVCPYCGRQYITNTNFKSLADLDHFYPKKFFPLLTLSLYNFIPSCHICNSRFKLASTKKILYPFDCDFTNSLKFDIDFKSPITNLKPAVNINIKPNLSKNEEEAKNFIDLFHLNEVYQSHNTLVSELLYRKRIYNNENFQKAINNLISTSLTNNEINILLYGYTFDLEQDCNRPLSKLMSDIISKL